MMYVILANGYIMGNFIGVRSIFKSTIEELPPVYSNWYHYFFANKEIQKKGVVPQKKGCVVCGGETHASKECPQIRPVSRYTNTYIMKRFNENLHTIRTINH